MEGLGRAAVAVDHLAWPVPQAVDHRAHGRCASMASRAARTAGASSGSPQRRAACGRRRTAHPAATSRWCPRDDCVIGHGLTISFRLPASGRKARPAPASPAARRIAACPRRCVCQAWQTRTSTLPCSWALGANRGVKLRAPNQGLRQPYGPAPCAGSGTSLEGQLRLTPSA